MAIARTLCIYGLAAWMASIAMCYVAFNRSFLWEHHIRLPFFATAEIAYMQAGGTLLLIVGGVLLMNQPKPRERRGARKSTKAREDNIINGNTAQR